MKWIKFLGFTLITMTTFSAFASLGQDSVAVFHRPDKVIVLVTEKGLNSRLAQFMNSWALELNQTGRREALIWQSPNAEFTMRCFKNYDEHSCTFKLQPTSPFVNITPTAARIEFPLSASMLQDYDFEFLSSRNDYFRLSSANDVLSLQAIKKHSPEL